MYVGLKQPRGDGERYVSPARAAAKETSAHPNGHNHGDRKPTETPVTDFCYKSVNLSLEELKNIKMILFLIHEVFRKPDFPK